MSEIVGQNTRPLRGRPPRFQLPVGATDCHVHLYLPDFEAKPGGPSIPELATVQDYRLYQNWLGLERVVVAQPNAYQFDNGALLSALRQFDVGVARGVAVVTPNTPMPTLREWHALGVRGARIMNLPGGAVTHRDMLAVDSLVHELGWSLIVQFNGCDIADYTEKLKKLKCDYVIDHIGKFMPPVAPSDVRVDTVLKLIDRGNAWFKICGAYETSLVGGPLWSDVGAIAKRVIHYAPQRVIWGSNWPHVGVPRASYPDDVAQIDILSEWATDTERRLMLVDNPAKLYGF